MSWQSALEEFYPALVPFYRAKAAFLGSISPLHTRRDEICATADEYMRFAMKTRLPMPLSNQYKAWISEDMRGYGFEDESYGLLLALETEWHQALDWVKRQMRSDLFVMEAFLSDEHNGWDDLEYMRSLYKKG